ncbi:MAG: hypothetical protein JJE49_02510 [Peptostreptococcaceae bacterium]|nr:hypothetical protein [Peptostreptococcaceae bacterium]
MRVGDRRPLYKANKPITERYVAKLVMAALKTCMPLFCTLQTHRARQLFLALS